MPYFLWLAAPPPWSRPTPRKASPTGLVLVRPALVSRPLAVPPAAVLEPTKMPPMGPLMAPATSRVPVPVPPVVPYVVPTLRLLLLLRLRFPPAMLTVPVAAAVVLVVPMVREPTVTGTPVAVAVPPFEMDALSADVGT